MIENIILILQLVLGILLIIILVKPQKKQDNSEILNELNMIKESIRMSDNDELIKEIRLLNESTLSQIREMRTGLESILNFSSQTSTEKLNSFMMTQGQSLNQFSNQINQLTKTTMDKFDKMVSVLGEELEKLVSNNERKLNEMRQTVDEKLNTTLEKRLNDSFNLISARLEAVYTGLGEMKTLANGVGELKNVLTNVKNRGVMGEISLNNILKEIMTDNQYSENYQVKQGSQQRVDFAVFIPDKKGGKDLILPIDAKFPIESYLRLCDAYDKMDQELIAGCVKELESAVKKSAKSIAEKYINVPVTTDFAIMYLPIEGLYSEVVRRTGLIEELQRNYKILITGPNTLSAFLNSLQLGFKTLTIEKRSSEIWNILVGFKKEFTNFVDLLARSQKQITTVSTTLENATKRTQMIEKQLSKVDAIEMEVENEEIEFNWKDIEE